ncbi:MAG: hypothetical protein PHO23_00090 [Candidatus Pacebacteria bacterium]|nr:hypothetical protein [Candidatus Paceibacterota bacterium]
MNRYFQEEKDILKKKYDSKNKDFICSGKVLNYLKDEYPANKSKIFEQQGFPSLFIEYQGKHKYIFDVFDKITTYLIQFNKNRENLYENGDKHSSVASRVLNNFITFLNNIDKYKKLQTIEELKFSSEEKDIFQIENYVFALTQDQVNNYNKNVGILNKKIKEARDKNKKLNQENFIKSNYVLLTTLDKQILGKVSAEDNTINNNQELKKEFELFIHKSNIFKDDFKKFIENFKKHIFIKEYEHIFLSKKIINTISYK